MAITRHGINRRDSSPIAQSSFEETVDILFRAAMFSEKDPLRGVSENILLGQQCPLGTGSFSLVLDDGKLVNAIETLGGDVLGGVGGLRAGLQTPGRSPAAMTPQHMRASPSEFMSPASLASPGGGIMFSPIGGGASPGGSPMSPAFSPTSPGMSPTSPGYSPTSPGYSPTSPGYRCARIHCPMLVTHGALGLSLQGVAAPACARHSDCAPRAARQVPATARRAQATVRPVPATARPVPATGATGASVLPCPPCVLNLALLLADRWSMQSAMSVRHRSLTARHGAAPQARATVPPARGTHQQARATRRRARRTGACNHHSRCTYTERTTLCVNVAASPVACATLIAHDTASGMASRTLSTACSPTSPSYSPTSPAYRCAALCFLGALSVCCAAAIIR